jgi:hypothetical protein
LLDHTGGHCVRRPEESHASGLSYAPKPGVPVGRVQTLDDAPRRMDMRPGSSPGREALARRRRISNHGVFLEVIKNERWAVSSSRTFERRGWCQEGLGQMKSSHRCRCHCERVQFEGEAVIDGAVI